MTTTNHVRRSQLPLYSFWKLKPKQNLLLGHGYLSYEKNLNLYLTRCWNPMDSSEGGIWKLHCTSRVTTQANESKQVSCLGTCREGCTWCHLRPLAPILEILVCQTTSGVTFWRTMRNPSKKPSSPFSSPFFFFSKIRESWQNSFSRKKTWKKCSKVAPSKSRKLYQHHIKLDAPLESSQGSESPWGIISTPYSKLPTIPFGPTR